MAIKLASSTDISFNYILRGSIWENRLQLLEILGKTYELEEELKKVINKYENEEFKSNSYLHSAYKYKANIEYNRGNFKAALDYLINAQKYYPVKFYANKLHEIEISDYKNEFENLELLLSRNVCNIKDWQI
jgi:tetratricopeptide (TPR) repeat protein